MKAAGGGSGRRLPVERYRSVDSPIGSMVGRLIATGQPRSWIEHSDACPDRRYRTSLRAPRTRLAGRRAVRGTSASSRLTVASSTPATCATCFRDHPRPTRSRRIASPRVVAAGIGLYPRNERMAG